MLIHLQNGRVLQADGDLATKDILILGDSILDIIDPGTKPGKIPDISVDLEERLVFSGLINSHDHLVDSFWPAITGGPFATWQAWEKARLDSPQHQLMKSLSIADLYALGMYRNVLSGVTLVVEHFPLEVVQTFLNKPLISIFEHFFPIHSMSSERLAWGRDPAEEFRQSRGVLPFLLHAGEGTATESHAEFQAMERQGLLSPYTILMNGPNIDEADFEVIGLSGAKFVWCPISARQNYGHQPDLASLHKHAIPMALGTDSAISGSLNLLEDLRAARSFIRDHHPGLISDIELVHMVTTHPASFLRQEQRLGQISAGKTANLIIFPDSKNDHLESFFALRPEDFSLVIHNGRLVYGEEVFRSACSLDISHYSEVLVAGRPKILHGKILQLLDRIEHKLEHKPDLAFLPVGCQ